MSDPTLKDCEYLGDGAYARLAADTGDVVIFTHDGIHVTNSVFLEPKVLRAFKEWLQRKGL
jgi:hypothetical protein